MTADGKIPEVRIGKDQDGCWTVALADQFGWVTDTGEPLPADVVASWTPLVPLPEGGTEPSAKQAGETLRLWHGTLKKADESEYDHGYRTAYERITDWLEHEFPAIWAAGNAPQQAREVSK